MELEDRVIAHEGEDHPCCKDVWSVFKPACSSPKKRNTINVFPPKPGNEGLSVRIAKDYCQELHPDNILEEGCGVCGQLEKVKNMENLKDVDFDEDILKDDKETVTRKTRSCNSDRKQAWRGPIIDPKCSKVCAACSKQLKRGTVPELALVNGNWVGEIPSELQGLSFAEKLLVARVRHNYCVFKVVKSGQHKMKANAVMFSVPMPKIYQT
ncbi:hypothetical protein DENSPDRAFT_789765, partial [Dentipellis sp. KUC8613]